MRLFVCARQLFSTQAVRHEHMRTLWRGLKSTAVQLETSVRFHGPNARKGASVTSRAMGVAWARLGSIQMAR